jgi:hypothetical protein
MPTPGRTVIDISAPPVVKAVAVVDRSRTAEFDWLREHARKYAGQWVALDGTRLLAADPHLEDLLRRLTDADRRRNPLFHRVDTD